MSMLESQVRYGPEAENTGAAQRLRLDSSRNAAPKNVVPLKIAHYARARENLGLGAPRNLP